ncbi:MAG: ribosome recycling factor [Bacteroidales bacterium]|jgi:ribosome recycling factor|nr:ribosome recycling factor [Bacteroidales bacterium]MBO7345961.1 ribosome recycling factor [Bacteroidales bacterium]MBQ4478559.1 ribosome recycling factor [Bacteroidales bacterium]MBR4453964.1 ribosome recycling factor [Bacteroidales bacterium]MCR5554455.1 ribosome recycling factor [Bacteroidales bacterium]
MVTTSSECLSEMKNDMTNSLNFLKKELEQIRAGKANPKMLEGVKVDYYGTPTPIEQVASIGTPDPKQILIQPWEKSMIGPIEKAIMAANLGFNPQNNGEIIRVIVPTLTEERRKELVKRTKQETEQAKVNIRNIRRNANDQAKKLKDNGVSEDEIKKLENDIQKATDTFIADIDKLFAMKEKEIMTV